MRKIVALLILISLQAVLFLAMFRVLPLDDLPFIRAINSGGAGRSLRVMVDAFIELKILAQASAPNRPALEAWVYLDEVQKKNDMRFTLYNHHGERSVVPGGRIPAEKGDERVMKVIQTRKELFMFDKGRVFYGQPLYADKECLICHEKSDDSFIGVAAIEYTDEWKQPPSLLLNALLVLLSLLNSLVAVWVLMHDPFAQVKELFDKK